MTGTPEHRMGRPPNRLRAAARAAGKRFYTAAMPCDRCGTRLHYVSNSGCVACAIEAGCARYEAIADDPEAKATYNSHQNERRSGG